MGSDEAPHGGGEPEVPRDVARRNFVLGIANGALVRVGMGFINPSLVLAGFVYYRTSSNLLVGLIATLSSLGHFWPQLYMSSLIEHRPRKMPYYVAATIIRVVLLCVMSATIWLSGASSGNWVLVVFFATYFVYRSAQGAGGVPFFDLVGQSVLPEKLGGFFALRTFFGEILNVLCALMVVQWIIANVSTPNNYALLASIATVLMAVGWGVWCLAREQKNSSPPRKRSFRETLVGGFETMRTDRNYRILVFMRILLRFNFLTVAFFVPYGVERLGAVGMGGVYVGARSVSMLFSSLLWGRISNRRGNRVCLVASGLLFGLAPVVALAAPRLPEVFSLSLPALPVPLDLPLCVYLLSLCFFGLAMQANMIARNSFVLEIAPPARRPSYIAFVNTIAFPLTILPTVVGALVGREAGRLDAVFILIAFSGLLTFLAALRLREVRQPAGAAG